MATRDADGDVLLDPDQARSQPPSVKPRPAPRQPAHFLKPESGPAKSAARLSDWAACSTPRRPRPLLPRPAPAGLPLYPSVSLGIPAPSFPPARRVRAVPGVKLKKLALPPSALSGKSESELEPTWPRAGPGRSILLCCREAFRPHPHFRGEFRLLPARDPRNNSNNPFEWRCARCARTGSRPVSR